MRTLTLQQDVVSVANRIGRAQSMRFALLTASYVLLLVRLILWVLPDGCVLTAEPQAHLECER